MSETKLTCKTIHWREEHYNHGEGRGADPTPGAPGMGDPQWEDISP